MPEIEKYLRDVAREKGISPYEVASMAMEALVENFGPSIQPKSRRRGRVMSKMEFRERFMADMRRLKMTA